jgi:two-component system, NtrC family, response regulator
MPNILVIDDDTLMCNVFAQMIAQLGPEAYTAHTLRDGLALAIQTPMDIILLDVGLPDGNGLEEIPKFRKLTTQPDVIIITGQGDPNGAELAIKSGAWDYLQKPASLKAVTLAINRVLQYREEKLAKPHPISLKRDAIIGDSPEIAACLEQVAQCVHSEAPVLITGETGTGKELFADAIHQNSPRNDKNFVVVDCAALPNSLVESVLFGHEQGAFTGADRARTGLIEQAHKGTLFLDEVGELPLEMQGAFLRALQERKFRPIGSAQEKTSDFRLVAATNRNLEKMVANGQFREDLLFRLKAFNIELPPLRDRLCDLIPLSMHYVSVLCERQNIDIKGFSTDFFITLSAYEWKGNVRELLQVLAQAVATAHHETTLFPLHLPMNIRVHKARSSIEPQHSTVPPAQPAAAPTSDNQPEEMLQQSFREYREQAELRYLRDLLKQCRGNIKNACEFSGLSRSRLYGLMTKYDISRPDNV